MVPPQPLAETPQVMPGGQLVAGVHPAEHVPLMHADVDEQLPQERIPPQPSGTSPHVTPVGHTVSGVQALHWPSMQVAPPSHVPQLMNPPSPQPLGYSPHV
jgi:hypothetical protein